MGDDEQMLARLDERVATLRSEIGALRAEIRDREDAIWVQMRELVKLSRYRPVEAIAYGIALLVGSSFVAAVVARVWPHV